MVRRLSAAAPCWITPEAVVPGQWPLRTSAAISPGRPTWLLAAGREAQQVPAWTPGAQEKSHHCRADSVRVWKPRMPGTFAMALIACW